ncbi:MAG: malate synthase A [Rubrobacter sp.]|nr:malate synthase A [Rubrobacter sp.]
MTQAQSETHKFGEGVEIQARITDEHREIVSDEAVAFVATLTREFGGRVEEILQRRQERQERFDAGEAPGFLEETKDVREGDWRVAPVPADLRERRVEITGPPDRKMAINALNSGAKIYLTDFEDANCPTWRNMLDSQLNLRDAIKRDIAFDDPKTGKHYELNDEVAVLIARPRGWHLVEKHMLVDGKPVPAGIFDFGLYFFHNAKRLLENGSGPYFYLPKMESHLEARLWNDVFVMAQDELGIPQGTIKATVLIETFPAAFEMEEILYELREHSAGLNAGRWDYIFSYIKTFRNWEDRVLPDRASVTMTVPFMRAYTQLLIKSCHRRGAHAIGGMAAQIPVPNDPEANEQAFEKVRQDKQREAEDGCDGTWVAHPSMVHIAKDVFDEIMPQDNQLDKQREDVSVTAEQLSEPCDGDVTEAGLRNNVSAGVQYIAAWLAGRGAVPVFNLMEDAATAEISRAQVWQWIHNPGGVLDDGREVTVDLFRQILREEMDRMPEIVDHERTKNDRFEEAAELFDRISTSDEFVDFLTLPGYEILEK